MTHLMVEQIRASVHDAIKTDEAKDRADVVSRTTTDEHAHMRSTLAKMCDGRNEQLYLCVYMDMHLRRSAEDFNRTTVVDRVTTMLIWDAFFETPIKP